jgi:hypothetical protein
MDNTIAWTENWHGLVQLYNNGNQVTMRGDDSTTAGKSFGYNDLTFKIYCKANQNGVVLRDGGLYYNGTLKIRGNAVLSGSAQACATLVITGQCRPDNPQVGNYSYINSTQLEIQSEAGGPGNTQATILFGSPATGARNRIQNCTGNINFQQYSVFTNLTAAQAGAFQVSGSVTGDPLLNQIYLAGGYGQIFSNGNDGTVVLDGTTTFSNFASLAGSTYTLTRDMYANSLTINNGVTLKPAGFRIFSTTSVTNNGTIDASGGNASGATAGAGVSNSNGIFLPQVAGATGGTGAGVQGAGGGTGYGSGNAAAGGAGSGGAGGAQRTGTGNVAPHRLPQAALTGTGGWNAGARQVGGTGGAASGGGDGTNAGGGGGASGGVIAIFAPVVTNAGTISANGGNGGTPGAGNCGGGGGGAGGIILIYSRTAWTAGTTSVTGGTHGTHTGTGADGSDGTAGSVLNEVLV